MTASILISALTKSFKRRVRSNKYLQELQEREQRYTLATSADGVWDWNLITGHVYFSRRWAEMIGYEKHELQSTLEEWISRIHPEDRSAVRNAFETHIQRKARSLTLEFRIQHRDGRYMWVLCRGTTVFDHMERPFRIVGSQTDITERKDLELRLTRQALYDSLTGLPNRALFLDRLSRAIECHKRDSTCSLAVLFIDLDNFKQVNDTMGHINGDRLLVVIAERLRRCVRPADTVARFGGDEFVVLLEGLKSPATCDLVVERIHKQLEAPMLLDDQELTIRASIGIALGSGENIRSEELIATADQAMYRVKALTR
ncbi:MAG TPA: sensor domain-containing diguanylate cyclase, partial [Acidobacteriota bacterium]